MKEITALGGKAIAVQANMSKPEEIERLFAKSKKAFGRLDILVNNAGIYEFSPLEKVTDGALPQALQPERARPAPGLAGGGKAIRWGRRKYH